MLSSFLLILIVRTYVFHWWLILPRLLYPESYDGISKVCPIYYWCKYIEAFHVSQLDFSNVNVSSLSHLLPWSSTLILIFFFFSVLAALCGLLDLIPWLGVESRPPTVEAWVLPAGLPENSLNHVFSMVVEAHTFHNFFQIIHVV